ncbi:MAG: carbonic anhydrase [Deltaproteobacteria bacterium]|nr:carbonic anhydrase [Deltaproteobacteria bacterium]
MTSNVKSHDPDHCAALEDSDLLLLQNKAWSQGMVARDPKFFSRLSETQKPKFLWIGCSDSRVAADTITGTVPGQIFVHRNIANVVVHSDLNLLSVLTYAVEHLEVEHVIVCGHHGCGGVKAAMSGKDFGMLNKWLLHIKDSYGQNYEALQAMTDERAREDRLCELHAIRQVHNLAKTAIIQRAWQERKGPFLHAWVYDLRDGILQPQITIAPDHKVQAPFRFDFED